MVECQTSQRAVVFFICCARFFRLFFLYGHTFVLVVSNRLAVNFLLVFIWSTKLLATSLTKSIPTGDRLWILELLAELSAFQFLKFSPYFSAGGFIRQCWAVFSVDRHYTCWCWVISIDIFKCRCWAVSPPLNGVESISPPAGVELFSPLTVLVVDVECLTFGFVSDIDSRPRRYFPISLNSWRDKNCIVRNN